MDKSALNLFKYLISKILNNDFDPDNLNTFVSYKDVHTKLGLQRISGTYGRSLELQGLGSLASWLKSEQLPAITGLIITEAKKQPADGFFKLYGKDSRESRDWWKEEIEKVLHYDWVNALLKIINKNEDNTFMPTTEIIGLADLDFEFKLNLSFQTVFDMGHVLTNIQALFSGFFYSIEPTELEYEWLEENDIHELNLPSEFIKTINTIPNIDDSIKDKILTDISKLLPVKKKMASLQTYSTRSQKISSQYKNKLRLRSFKQGSLLLEITSSVLGGLLLKFLEKLLFKEEQSNTQVININIENSCIIINKHGESKLIKSSEYKDYFFNDNKEISHAVTSENFINKILDQVTYDSMDIESSVKSLFEVLEKERVISKYTSYDKRATKTVVRDISKLKGALFNVQC
ncbi:hypothetical protein GC093_20690 [Paenibacillus sp. LMG 31456]|uniref:Uncharacterized protein n=1 Tax=Paenibacillus foliorum TaxID=2654974 RepID=A0A972GWU6_9BACL|nr:hypothetical protein [Paenibacillus foliorum]NOU95628.1 hypothetical protein [Paenibacillus foliorum]